MNNVQNALTIFENKYSCAQAVAAACGPQLGLDKDIALKVASAFGGGIGGRGETCGAVSGALIVLGLKYDAQDAQAKEKIYQLARTFIEKFCVCHSSIICKELLCCVVGTDEGKNFV